MAEKGWYREGQTSRPLGERSFYSAGEMYQPKLEGDS